MNKQTAFLLRRLWTRNVGILLVQFALLYLSFSLAFVPLNGYNTAVNVFLAAIMALIGFLFFMGLNRESTLLRLAATGGIFWLIIMFALTFADYFTRTL